jgi:hypothetical protein
MPKASAKVSSNVANYDTFLKSVRLFIIALDNVSGALDRDRYWGSRNKKGRMVRAIDATYEARDVQRDHFDVVARMEIAITNEKDDTELVKISCQYSAHFHARQVNLRTAERFANSEAKLIFWPYFRQIVSDVSSRMSIPPVTVPLSFEP